ncbi:MULTISPECIES: ROK family transcriptional regulator [Arthrobacter]|uniref:ROK family transcriptional regulator n=1 Tax=Arthrobacter terricola TaxID=2547396 RepID=A0A4R5K9C1_9MICC|nr:MULTISPECIES: ROK family transcriptional regulator [Arthrobacter]MBT8163510.1 ROK family transcriptional regulator [Arthrobacter sp. GN70]TDF89447.1 ROK family transcriptional regulator [Arthrobacter terricola]
MDATPVHPSWLGEPSSTRDVLYRLLIDGPMSRSALAERLGLSAASLSRVTKPLLASGELREVPGRHVGPTGRPTQPLEVDADRHHFIGVKVTGTHAYAALVNLRADVLDAADAPLRSKDPDHVIAVVARLANSLQERGTAASGLGVCLGGQVREDGSVGYAPFLEWQNVPFGQQLAAATSMPVAVANDLNALTLIEHWHGAGRGVENLIILTIGAGVGYGLVINNQLINDVNAGLGQVGHTPLDPTGPACGIGHRGCANVVLSTRNIEAQAAVSLGKSVPYDRLMKLAAEDPVARQVVDQAAFSLGRLMTIASAFTMPQKIVLTGEGVELAVAAPEALKAGRSHDREQHTPAVPLEIVEVSHTHWARGAAIAAMQLPAPSLAVDQMLEAVNR